MPNIKIPPSINSKLTPFYSKKVILPLVLLIVILGGALFLQLQKPTIPSPSPTPTPSPKLKILFPLNPDKAGRNIYYSLNESSSKSKRFSGVGVYNLAANTEFKGEKGEVLLTTDENSQFTDYIVGSFVKWEDIPNSSDKYLILKDNLGVKNPDGQSVVYPKIRVGFTVKYKPNSYNTALGLEDLSALNPKSDNKTEEIKRYTLRAIGSFSKTDLENIIKVDDALAITLKTDFSKNQDLVDENEAKIASWIMIRRFYDQGGFEEELLISRNLK